MLDRILPLLLLAGILAILYRAFLHSPRTPPSGKNHEESDKLLGRSWPLDPPTRTNICERSVMALCIILLLRTG